MSGTIHGAAPWTRLALRQFAHDEPDLLASIEADIPDGHHVTLTCGGRPRPLGAVLVGPSGEVGRVEPAYYSVGSAVAVLLYRQLVVENTDGYVVVADVA